jgi:hypothetical protein
LLPFISIVAVTVANPRIVVAVTALVFLVNDIWLYGHFNIVIIIIIVIITFLSRLLEASHPPRKPSMTCLHWSQC